MATKIMVDTTQIESAKTKIQNLQQDYQSAYGRLYEIDGEINETWQGVDSKKFSEQLQGFKNDFQDLDKKFSDYIKFLEDAKTQYDAAQEKITKDAEKLAVDR